MGGALTSSGRQVNKLTTKGKDNLNVNDSNDV
jgi:hypothetical protein